MQLTGCDTQRGQIALSELPKVRPLERVNQKNPLRKTRTHPQLTDQVLHLQVGRARILRAALDQERHIRVS